MKKENQFITKLLKDPLEFTDEDFSNFILFYKEGEQLNSKKAFKDLRYCLQKVYDINKKRLIETSNANSGLMGIFNKFSTSVRKKKYFKKVENIKEHQKYIKIYSEGDSWFQFPIFIRGITDQLKKTI